MPTGDIDGAGFGAKVFAHIREFMPLTNVMQGGCPITDVTTIGERLTEAREELGFSQEELARLAGVSKGTIGNIEAGTRKDPRALLEIAAAAQVLPEWLKHGKPPKRPPNWSSPQHAAMGVIAAQVAHDMSQPTPDHESPKITWEFMVSAVISTLPKRFRLAMPDDAMAPNTPRGLVLVFSTDVRPVFGDGVLVQDANGHRHVRRYVQGQAGEWKAEARNNAYLTLHSAGGLQVLAVVVGRETSEI